MFMNILAVSNSVPMGTGAKVMDFLSTHLAVSNNGMSQSWLMWLIVVIIWIVLRSRKKVK